jgi:hypothetical protein
MRGRGERFRPPPLALQSWRDRRQERDTDGWRLGKFWPACLGALPRSNAADRSAGHLSPEDRPVSGSPPGIVAIVHKALVDLADDPLEDAQRRQFQQLAEAVRQRLLPSSKCGATAVNRRACALGPRRSSVSYRSPSLARTANERPVGPAGRACDVLSCGADVPAGILQE